MTRSIALAVLLAGCSGTVTDAGSATSTVSCTITNTTRVGSFSSSFVQCIELSGATADQISTERNACSKSTSLRDGGVMITPSFSEAPCSRHGAAAGCRITSAGVTQTQWFYSSGDGGLSTSDLAKICANSGGSIIQP